jgi:hypothetical protein
MKTLLFILSVSLGLSNLQNKPGKASLIDWKVLSEIDFEDKYSKELEGWYISPIFSEKVKRYNNKQVIIKGYVIPLNLEGGQYALSAYPFSSCFFCGGSGPESVMTLKFKEKPRRYKTDDVVTFTGILELNDENPDDFCYVLNQTQEFTP